MHRPLCTRKNLFVLFFLLCCFNVRAQYCIPTYNYGCGDDFVESFSTSGGEADISNFYTGCGNFSTAYTYYSNQTAIVGIGSTFNFEFQNNWGWTEWYVIYVDFNADNDFIDPGERVYTSSTKINQGAIITGTITVPPGTLPAASRMRIMCDYSNSSPAPCILNSDFGECEDYNIIFVNPCVGKPEAGTVVTAAKACANAPHKFSLSGNTIAGGLSYQWQSRPPGTGSFSNISGANKSSVDLYVTDDADFRCVVTCTNGGLRDTTDTVTVTVNPFYFCYCKDNLGGNADVSIDRVQIHETTLDNSSAGTAAGSYTQYLPVGTTTATLQEGNMYSFTVNYGGYAAGSAWLDANRDGYFDDNEFIELNTNGKLATGTFIVPPGADPGLTGLRIRSQEAGSFLSPYDACSNFWSGETEDYVVTIAPGPNDDLRMLSFDMPQQNTAVCPFNDIPIQVKIYNDGKTTQSNIQVHAKLSGTLTNSFIYNYPGTLAPYASDEVTVGMLNVTVSGPYTLKAYVTSDVDDNALNDTLIRNFTIATPPTQPAVFNDTVCLGLQADVTVFTNGLVHKWYDSYTNGDLVFTGDHHTYASLMKDSILYVSAQFPSDTLTTVKTGTLTCAGGVMFDIVPNMNITIDSFAARFNVTGAQPVNIYYRQGTYLGNESTPTVWTKWGNTVKANPQSITELTNFAPSQPLTLAAGITWGIYLEYDPVYSTGGNTYSNSDLTIYTGAGLCSQFGGANANRSFNGTVYYHQGNTACPSERVPAAAILGAPPIVQLGKDIKECEGRTITLNAYNSGNAVYEWSTGDITPTISVTTGGKYWVTVDRYCKATDSVNIVLDPLPTVKGITFVRTGYDYTFAPKGLKNTTRILWLFGDGAVDTNTNTQHTYPTGGNYQVTLIAFNDCGSDTVDLVLPVSVKEVDRNDLVTVYPNPAQNVLNVKAEGTTKLGDILILNAVGAVVYKMDHIQQSQQEINTTSLPAGHYIIRMKTSEGVINRPFEIIR